MSNFLAVNRRHFLFAAVPLYAARPYQTFSKDEARTVEALCDQVILADATLTRFRRKFRVGESSRSVLDDVTTSEPGSDGLVQEMPVFESRVELAPDLKDHWGIPSLRVSGHRHAHDIEVGKFIAARCGE